MKISFEIKKQSKHHNPTNIDLNYQFEGRKKKIPATKH